MASADVLETALAFLRDPRSSDPNLELALSTRKNDMSLDSRRKAKCTCQHLAHAQHARCDCFTKSRGTIDREFVATATAAAAAAAALPVPESCISTFAGMITNNATK